MSGWTSWTDPTTRHHLRGKEAAGMSEESMTKREKAWARLYDEAASENAVLKDRIRELEGEDAEATERFGIFSEDVVDDAVFRTERDEGLATVERLAEWARTLAEAIRLEQERVRGDERGAMRAGVRLIGDPDRAMLDDIDAVLRSQADALRKAAALLREREPDGYVDAYVVDRLNESGRLVDCRIFRDSGVRSYADVSNGVPVVPVYFGPPSPDTEPEEAG